MKNLEGYDAFICTLGSRNQKDMKSLTEADRDLPMCFASLAKELDISYFSLLSAEGADISSWYRYNKVKGQAEEGTKSIGLKHLSIFRPNLIT